MLRTLRAKTSINKIFLLKKDVKMTMRILQKNSQNVRLLMFQKINEKRKNQNRDENKARVSCDENKKNLNCDDLLVCFNFKKHCDLNRKEHEAKNK